MLKKAYFILVGQILSKCLTHFGTVLSSMMMGLILIQAAPASAAPRCESIFQNQLSERTLITDYVQTRGSPTAEVWQSYLNEITTATEYRSFLKALFMTSALKEKRSDLRGGSLPFFLLNLDFVTPLLKMRPHLSAQEINHLTKDIDHYLQKTKEITADDRSDLDYLLFTAKVALQQKSFDFWLKNIPQDKRLVYDNNFFLHRSSEVLFMNLPESARPSLKNLLWKKLEEAFTNEKKILNEDAQDQAKTYRRNVETYHRLIYHRELQELSQGLKNTSEKNLVRKINAYWKKVYEPQWKDDYSFAQVLEIARVLQKSQLLKAYPKASVDLYGSFPNGKASLQKSDIDIHPDQSLMLEYVHMMTERIRDYSNPFSQERHGVFMKSKEEILNFSRLLVDTEKQVAQKLGVEDYKPSELMTLVPTLSEFFFQPEVINYYNPIRITVSANTLTVKIYDVLGSEGTRVVEVVLP